MTPGAPPAQPRPILHPMIVNRLISEILFGFTGLI
ncbi:MarC family protein, partial [Burkholderia cepacia]